MSHNEVTEQKKDPDYFGELWATEVHVFNNAIVLKDENGSELHLAINMQQLANLKKFKRLIKDI